MIDHGYEDADICRYFGSSYLLRTWSKHRPDIDGAIVMDVAEEIYCEDTRDKVLSRQTADRPFRPASYARADPSSRA